MRGRYVRTLLACASVVGVLLACRGQDVPGETPNPTPPAIHAPGFQRLTALSDLGYSFAGGPFRQNGGALQVLLNRSGATYVARLDGAGMRQVTMKRACDAYAVVTSDGMWAACMATDYATNSQSLEVVSLSASGTPGQTAIKLDSGYRYSIPAWSPDGAYLAALSVSTLSKECSIAVFELANGYTQATLRTTLTPAFSTPPDQAPRCGVNRLGWSHDGASLLIATYGPSDSSTPQPLLVDTRAPVGALIRAGTRSATIPMSEFTAVYGVNILSSSYPGFAWNPITGALALTIGGNLGGGDPGKVAIYTPGTHQPQTLFTLPYSGYLVLSLGWTADGSSLLVGIGGPTCGECGIGVQAWYLYTPGEV